MLASTNLGPNLVAHLCGAGGTFTALALALSPVQDILKCKSEGNLGGYDTRFWPTMYWSCLSWSLLGAVMGDVWLFVSQAPAAVLWLWFNLVALQLMSREEGELQDLPDDEINCKSSVAQDLALMRVMSQKFRIASESKTVTSILFFTMITLVSQFVASPTLDVLSNIVSADVRLSIFSFICGMSSIVCFGSPALRLKAVVQMQDASCIDLRTAFMALVNTLFWLTYGVLHGMWALTVPSAIGAASALLQLLAKLIIGNKEEFDKNDEDMVAQFDKNDEDVVAPVEEASNGDDCKEYPSPHFAEHVQLRHKRSASESTSYCGSVTSDTESESVWSPPQTPRLKRSSTINNLPDLKDRLEKYGMYEDYLKWQQSYRAWRCGKAKGAHGEVTDLRPVLPVTPSVLMQQAVVPGSVEQDVHVEEV